MPADLRWWCKGCGERHVHPSLWRATGIRGVLAIVGRDGRSPVFGAPPPAPPVEDPGGALARRYLQVHGPTTPLLFRYWAYLTLPHAKRLFARAGELAQLGDRWVLAEDAALDAPPPEGARLLPNLDPLASAKDREVLVPDEAVRKRIWRSLGGPGMALVDGEVAGLWRPRKKGKRLVVELEPLRKLTRRRARGAGRRSRAPRARSGRAETAELRYSVKSGSWVDLDDVHLGLLELARVVPVHRLPAGELVEHPDARLARAVARLAVAAERQVRLGARGRVVDGHHAGRDALAEAEGVRARTSCRSTTTGRSRGRWRAASPRRTS